MKSYLLLLLTAVLTIVNTQAQNIGINTSTPDPSAALDITSTTKGLLVPRLTNQQRLDIAVPARGLLVFDSTSNSFWYRDGDAWQELLPSTRAWKLTGNIGTDTSIHFLGTSDDQSLIFKVNNSRSGIIDHNYGNTSFGYQSLPFDGSLANTAIGSNTLFSNITGSHNTAIGGSALYSNTTGEQNSATGLQALSSNTIGSYNTANGRAALYYNTTGKNNTAIGYTALQSNITGYSNVAIGFMSLYSSNHQSNLVAIGDSALYNNGNGATFPFEAIGNTAVGSKALYSNTMGFSNTANGYQVLYSNSTGDNNTANGLQALYTNTTGSSNTANGYHALYSNIAGNSNTANGLWALRQNKTGNSNTASGSSALESNLEGNYNAAMGYYALFNNTSGSYNTANGYTALNTNTTGHHNTGFGSEVVTSSNSTYASALGAGATALCSNCMVLGGADATSRTKVGINITTPLTDLQIKQQSDAAGNTSRGIRLQRSTNAFWRMYVDGSSSLTFEYNDGGAGTWGWISTTGSFVDGSDARSKKNIQPSENVLDKLAMLQPKKYQFNAQGENGKYSYGFVAQEVQKIFPEFVHEREGGMLGITYGSFGVIAVKAIQEQQIQITGLKKENTALQQQLQNMMGMINTLNEKVGVLEIK